MKKLPFYLRLGFAIMGVDPYETKKEPDYIVEDQTPPNLKRQDPPKDTTKWISTDKQLPEYYKTIIIYTVDKEILYNWARVNDGREDYYIHPKEEKMYTQNEITHWLLIEIPQ